MIRLRRAASIHVHDGPADMRKSYDTLAALVREQMGAELFAGDVFLFVGKDRRRAKVLFFDGTGLCILQKRLSKGRFHAPWERQEITRSELERFLRGSSLVWAATPPMQPEELLMGGDVFC